MKRLTRRDEDTGQVYAMSDKQSIIDKLCLYEEAEERGDTVSPAADVRTVVRGHWISEKEAEEMGDIMKEFTCSVCGCCEWDCTESESFNFCPNCGADMRF